MAWIGWATDLKTVSPELIKKRMLRTGWKYNKNLVEGNDDKSEVWGWDDPEMPEDEKNLAVILNKTIA